MSAITKTATIVRVLHNLNNRFVSTNDPDYCANTRLVATVTVPDGKDARQWAFRVTSHIDSNCWMTNPSVAAEPGNHRSTSVGDVLEVVEPGKPPVRYILDFAGYIQL
jgi:hypothetical protein